jgi:hypothetical protein
MSTTLAIDLEEFAEYNIASEQLVTFSLKELKAVIAFADVAAAPVEVAFSAGGEYVARAAMSRTFIQRAGPCSSHCAASALSPSSSSRRRQMTPPTSKASATSSRRGARPRPQLPRNRPFAQDRRRCLVWKKRAALQSWETMSCGICWEIEPRAEHEETACAACRVSGSSNGRAFRRAGAHALCHTSELDRYRL